MQGTFAVRFNRLRNERGHLFQGRYKSLIVDPDEGLGRLCHYIHLNPVRAKLRKLRRKPKELAQAGKSADWKLAVAAASKTRTTVTNRWPATTLHMGNLDEVSRKVSAWARPPNAALDKKLS